MERRSQYRVEVGDDVSLQALVLVNEAGIPGLPVDLTANGAGIQFHPPRSPTLQLGDAVHIEFTSERVDKLRIAARVVYRAEEGGGTRYGFRFKTDATRQVELPPALLQLFNRRSAYRVDVDPRTPVPVTLAPASKTRSHEARLVDISSSGAGVRAPVEIEAALASDSSIRMEFSLPTSPDAIRCEGVIRHRKLHGGEVHYGIAFAPDPADTRRHKTIVDFVMQRQRELLRKTSDAAAA